jgi:hypothetical protein
MLDWLGRIKVSITNWVLLSLSAVIGVLVFLLRRQGRELHKAKVDLLKARHKAERQVKSARTKEALTAYKKAKKVYEDAKKSINR